MSATAITSNQTADEYRILRGTPVAEHAIAVQARCLVDEDLNVILDAADLATIGAATVALTGAIAVNDTTTPSVTLTNGSTNTGFFWVKGKTSGGTKYTTADATGQTVTVSTLAQTVGAATLSIPNFAGVSDTYVFCTLAQSLASKTLVSPVISTGLTASGSASNDFSGSTGAHKTSTGLNTLGGKVAQKVIATPVAAAGSTASDAGALGSANIVEISSDSAAKGVKLVAGVAGDIVHIINTSSTAAVLYPATGGTINGLSANAGVVIPASKGTKAICDAADTWKSFDLAAKSTAA